MILLKLFLFLSSKGILAFFLNVESKSNSTERSGVQMWRAEGVFDQEVLEIFEERAHLTEEIWKRDNRTIDFLLFDKERKSLGAFLDAYNVSHKVLIDDVRDNVDDTMLARFPPTKRIINETKTITKSTTATTNYGDLIDPFKVDYLNRF